MASDAELIEARVLVDSYGASSPMVRLAELAAPACRIEPQLLRRLRLECVPDADVSVEQELWHSEFVNSRGSTITFRRPVSRVLRESLRAQLSDHRALVERARRIMISSHSALPPLLILEDELAWAEIFAEDHAIQSGAQKLLRSLLARRDGLNHWLGRAWSGLPSGLKQLPEGRQLAQVAASEGAVIEQESAPSVDQVANVLPLIALPIRVDGARLEINATPAEATHAIEIPNTSPRALSVRTSSDSTDLVFDATEVRLLDVEPGIVVLRTLAGTEYELEIQSAGARFEVEMLAAEHATSLIIDYGTETALRRVVVDCGTRRSARRLAERLKSDVDVAIELLVFTHIDDQSIGAADQLLADSEIQRRLQDVWFNGSESLMFASEDAL